MNSPDDTIAAISTPRGEGGIGIVRLSGRDAVSIADKVFSSPKGKRLRDRGTHTVTYGFIVDPARAARIDEVLVTVMRAPGTYTMEDVVEINCHGGMLPLSATLKMLLREGARLAEPGEFTKRAFLNGRMDLSQAEAVIDIIKARTVPKAAPLVSRACTIGITPAALLYIGTPMSTATGTAHQLPFPIIPARKFSGTYP